MLGILLPGAGVTFDYLNVGSGGLCWVTQTAEMFLCSGECSAFVPDPCLSSVRLQDLGSCVP